MHVSYSFLTIPYSFDVNLILAMLTEGYKYDFNAASHMGVGVSVARLYT